MKSDKRAMLCLYARKKMGGHRDACAELTGLLAMVLASDVHGIPSLLSSLSPCNSLTAVGELGKEHQTARVQ